MGDPKALTRTARNLAAVVAIATLLGCVQIQLKLREPGEFNRAFPGEIADEYQCSERRLPFFEIEEDQLLPERVAPGSEFSHRLQYVLCPVEETQVVSGTLHTRILYKGKPIHSETSRRELQPGRWIVDEFITLPSNAKPGVYALQSEFQSRHGGFDSRSTFLVED